MAVIDGTMGTVVLQGMVGQATFPTFAVGTAKVRLLSATNSTPNALGTELPTANGYTAGGSVLTFSAPASATALTIASSASISWTASGTGFTVAAIEIWDSQTTPRRWWFGPLTGGAVPVNGGNTFQFAVGAVTASLA